MILSREQVLDALALTTGAMQPRDHDERAKLKAGDQRLLAVLRTGHTLHGRPLPGILHPNLPPRRLSPRQQDAGRLLLEGLTTQEVADRMGVSYFTAQTHLRALAVRLEERMAWRAAIVAAVLEWL